jgi:hypothetical protein
VKNEDFHKSGKTEALKEENSEKNKNLTERNFEK